MVCLHGFCGLTAISFQLEHIFRLSVSSFSALTALPSRVELDSGSGKLGFSVAFFRYLGRARSLQKLGGILISNKGKIQHYCYKIGYELQLQIFVSEIFHIYFFKRSEVSFRAVRGVSVCGRTNALVQALEGLLPREFRSFSRSLL